MHPQQWREAMAAAKLAVRAYARNPSSSNAAEVELAWHRVRRLRSVANWQRQGIARVPSSSLSATGRRREALTDP